MTPTILVVEDEPAILELLKVNLVDAGYEVRAAGDAETAHALLKEALPDLVLLDWMLPGQSGLAFAKQLRADPRTKELPVIMVTARTDEADRVAGLEAWVDDYVTKPFSPRELKARIKSVLRRRAPEAAQEPLSAGALAARSARRIASPSNGAGRRIGPTEFRLLRFLLARPERVHSRAQLLDQVWGDHVYIEERTVDVHIRRLRLALEPFGLDNLIETVRGSGYRLARAALARDVEPCAGRPQRQRGPGPICAAVGARPRPCWWLRRSLWARGRRAAGRSPCWRSAGARSSCSTPSTSTA